VGVAFGAAAGVYGGALFDLASAGVGASFLDEAAKLLLPGKAALVAEIQEEWVLPLDTRMEAAGGTVIRRTRADVVDAQIARDIAALNAEIDELEAEAQQATGEAKARIESRIAAAKAELQRTQDRAKASIDAAEREAEAKITALVEQSERARAEHRARLDKRMAEVEAERKERTAKIEQARQLQTQAGELVREALAP
jgi:hypothetical protein